VTISAITYLVLEFPKTLIASIMALFAFGDVGGILANLLFSALKGTQYGVSFFLFSIVLLVGLIWYIAVTFLDPQFPKHLQKRRLQELLRAHELVKLRFPGAGREERASLCAQISDEGRCVCVGAVGRTALFFRRNPNPGERRVELPG